MPEASGAVLAVVRVRVFIDFWNFKLSLDGHHPKFNLDWKRLGPWLAQRAGDTLGVAGRVQYEGLHVYLSHDPNKQKDDGLRRWATSTLDRFPGVEVVLKERKPKNPPNCPICHKAVEDCPHCKASMKGTMEKGVDTAIVTDMIRLAWEDSWDAAVLVSADRDFVPAVEFLSLKGKKVIHATLPPQGAELARKCWGQFNLLDGIEGLERT